MALSSEQKRYLDYLKNEVREGRLSRRDYKALQKEYGLYYGAQARPSPAAQILANPNTPKVLYSTWAEKEQAEAAQAQQTIKTVNQTTNKSQAPPVLDQAAPQAIKEEIEPEPVRDRTSSPGSVLKTADVYQRIGTGEQYVIYGDNSAKRIKSTATAELARQGGKIEYTRDQYGRPQISKIIPPKDATPIYNEIYPPAQTQSKAPEVIGYEITTKTEAPPNSIRAYEYSTKLEDARQRAGDLAQQQASAERLKGNYAKALFLEAGGAFERTIGESQAAAKDVLRNPTPWAISGAIAGGLVLLGTKNPPLAAKAATAISTATAALIPVYVTNQLKNIGEGTQTVGGAIGETGAYALIGYTTAKTAQTIINLRSTQDLKLVQTKGVTKTYQTPGRTVQDTKAVSQLTTAKNKYVVQTDINQIKITGAKYATGTGTYTITQATPGGPKIVKTGSLTTVTNPAQAASSSIINIDNKQILYDQSYFKTYTTGDRDVLSYLYSISNPRDLPGATFIQLTASKTNVLTQSATYGEGGGLIGINTREYYAGAGIQDTRGLNIIETYTNKVGIKANLPQDTTGVNLRSISAKGGVTQLFKDIGTVTLSDAGGTATKAYTLSNLKTPDVSKALLSEALTVNIKPASVYGTATATPATATKTSQAETFYKVFIPSKTQTAELKSIKTEPDKKPSVKPVNVTYTGPKERNKTFTAPSIKGNVKIDQSQRQGDLNKIIPAITQKPIQEETTKEKIDLRQDQTLISETTTPGIITPIITITPGVETPFNPPAIPIPSLRLPGGSSSSLKRARRQPKTPPKTVYNPGTRAILSGTTAKSIPKLSVKTGLGDRPVIKKRKRLSVFKLL